MLITYITDKGTVTILAATIIRLDHIHDGQDGCGERTIVETSRVGGGGTTFVARESTEQYAANLQTWREALARRDA